MDALTVVLLLLAALIVVLWVLRKRARAAADDEEPDRLDTVAAWPPSATRVLDSAERLAYKTLVRALPGHMILAKVPLARFLKVPSRHSYSEWLRRLGNQCADFVVCDMASEVIAVVSVQPPAAEVSERARKRHKRMSRVMKAAGIALHEWTENALPTADRAREALLPKPAEAAPQRPTTSRPSPLDASAEPETAPAPAIVTVDPPPSTWFDEFNSGPGTLQSPKQPP